MLLRPSKLIIVVLYNCDFSSSETIKSLLLGDSVRKTDKLVIWDNSPIMSKFDDSSLFNITGLIVEYIHTPENVALSKVYNDSIKANADFDFAVILDQDSQFDESFFNSFESAYQNNQQIPLFLPQIFKGKQIVSPGHYHYFKGKYWSNAQYGIVKAKNNVAIASGLIIKLDAVKKIGYFEERLSLYGIDTNFMIRFSRFFTSFYVLNVKFDHDLSGFNNESIETKVRRFKNHKDAAIFNSKLFPFYIQIIAKGYYYYKSIKNAIQFKRVSFLS